MASFLLSLILSLVSNFTDSPVTIRTNPRILMVNQAVRVMCIVPHRAQNRRLRMELVDYRSSEWDLEGEAAPKIFTVTYEHVPCVVTTAACSLMDDLGRVAVATLPLQVAGPECEERP